MARKLPKSLQSWLIPILRKASLRWPGKAIARDNARIIVDDGVFKNGNPKTKIMYKCASCEILVDRDGGQMDHTQPVIEISGFKDWNTYMPRLFCTPDEYQHLCIECHTKKTVGENKQRGNLTYSKKYARINKSSKYDRKNKRTIKERKRRRP